MKNPKKSNRSWLLYLALHAGFFLSSLSGLCAKMAGRQEETWKWIAWYLAYANKPVGLIWAMIWGSLIFQERITWRMLLGAAVIFAGIYLVVTDHE